MLLELNIANFAIIDQLHLALSPGLNVLTGETGAGKSIIIDAVSTLLGGRADSDLIRSGTEGARVEGVFALSESMRREYASFLEAQGLDDGGDTLILVREINRNGRHVCRVNGRAVTLAVLGQVGERLVDIHGQSEHLSLLRVKEHLHFLDRYGGLQEQRAALADRVRALRRVREELAALKSDERELARRADLLQYQVREIEDAALQPGEEDRLLSERRLLLNAERLSTLANAAFDTLGGGNEEQHTVVDLLDRVLRDLAELERLDPRVSGQRKAVEESLYTLDDVARTLRSYRDSIEFNPARLQMIEERLELVRNLQRKYGNSIAEILHFAKQAAEQLYAIEHNEERIAELEKGEAALVSEAGELAANLSAARREAADRLQLQVERELDELNMVQARFVVDMHWRESEDGILVGGKRYAFDLTGIDQLEFLISPNVGEPPKPLAKIASGGETSRLMMALKTVLAHADNVPTLIFDEIDQGIGGRTGSIVGRKLWGLTSSHQVLCVTHLPQLACYADAHYRVDKIESDGRTVTRVQLLDDESRVDELAAMIGGPAGQARRRSAEEMYKETLEFKRALARAQRTATSAP